MATAADAVASPGPEAVHMPAPSEKKKMKKTHYWYDQIIGIKISVFQVCGTNKSSWANRGWLLFFFSLRNVYVGSSLAREVMIKKPGTDDLGKALLAEVIRSYLTADARRIPAIRNSEDSSARVFSFESLAVIQ